MPLRDHLHAHRGDSDSDWMLATIRWLDLWASEGGDTGRLLNQRASAALVCAAVAELSLRWPAAPLQTTGRAAKVWMQHPSEQGWQALFSAASASYPFGPGEGCHAVERLGGHGAPGSGCRSGVGWAWSLSDELGSARVRALWEPLLERLAGKRRTPPDGVLGPIETMAGSPGKEGLVRRRIGSAVWGLRDLAEGRDPEASVGPRYRADELTDALPPGASLPTRWQWLEVLRAAGVEIVTGPWHADIKPLWQDTELAFAARRPARPGASERTAWWMRSLDGPEDLFVLHESQNHQHFTFACSRARERALVRPVWSPQPLPERERILTDSRDGQRYRVLPIGGLMWMADSVRLELPGSLSLPHRTPTDAAPPGRYYAREQLEEACPRGWRVPTRAEWESLLRRFGGLSCDVHPTPGELLMALRPGGASGFELLAQGQAEPWMIDLEPEVLADCEPDAATGGEATLWSDEGAITLTSEQAWPFSPVPAAPFEEVLRPLRCVRELGDDD